VIKPGMQSEEVVKRFRGECQALALMDRPNIAHVFDAGTSDDGHPYFVLEHVRGTKITEFCDSARMTVDDRSKLFLQVCAAVEHAHGHGLLHRDLKPSNVLVADTEGDPCAKIIDFGVARSLKGNLTEHSFHTQAGHILGTPA